MKGQTRLSNHRGKFQQTLLNAEIAIDPISRDPPSETRAVDLMKVSDTDFYPMLISGVLSGL